MNNTETPDAKGLRNNNGKWQYRFMHNGVPQAGSTGLDATPQNVAAAQRIRQEAIRSMGAKAKRQVVSILQAKTLKQALMHFNAWYAAEHPNGNIKWQVSTLKNFEYHFVYSAPRTMQQINAGAMEDYKTWRRQPRADNSVIHGNTLRHELKMIKQFFGFCIKHGWIEHNPMDHVKIPAEQGSEAMHVLTLDEEIAYMEAAKKYPALADLARIMIDQGLRPDEAMKLKQANVDIFNRKFKVWDSTAQGKTKNAMRTLWMTDFSYEVFKRRLSVDSPWIFPSDKLPGEPRSTFQKNHETVRKLAGVECRLYDFRHTFATRFALYGGSMPMLADILGHADLSLLMRYVHISQDDMNRAMDGFNESQKKEKFERMKAAFTVIKSEPERS